MGKTKPSKSKDAKKKRKEKSLLNRVAATPSSPSKPVPAPAAQTQASNLAKAHSLLLESTNYLSNGALEKSAKPARQALALLDSSSVAALPALNLLGEISIELGDVEKARGYFAQAAAVDEDGKLSEEEGGGAEKFLWLAELSEVGGRESVGWFERGVACLRRQIEGLNGKAVVEEKKKKLAVALCGVVEVYMTDLSWEEDAEAKCEALVTEATLVCPGLADVWQTLANVRISQSRMEDARAALERSLELWEEVEVGDDVPARVSLSRLLLEAGMEGEALEVLELLVGGNDQSVEVWYLGGWGLFVMGEKQKGGDVKSEDSEGDWRLSWISSRQWLLQSLKLFEQQDYEDERLGEHASELLAVLNKELGAEVAGEGDEDGDDWEDDDDSAEDEEMGGA